MPRDRPSATKFNWLRVHAKRIRPGQQPNRRQWRVIRPRKRQRGCKRQSMPSKQNPRTEAWCSRKLDQLAQFLADHPDRRLEIDGFTDSVGPDSYNLDLSQRRANAVKSALQVRGIGATRITTQGYGKEFPVASNADSGGRQLNRCVEVVIGGENGAAIEARDRR